MIDQPRLDYIPYNFHNFLENSFLSSNYVRGTGRFTLYFIPKIQDTIQAEKIRGLVPFNLLAKDTSNNRFTLDNGHWSVSINPR